MEIDQELTIKCSICEREEIHTYAFSNRTSFKLVKIMHFESDSPVIPYGWHRLDNLIICDRHEIRIDGENRF